MDGVEVSDVLLSCNYTESVPFADNVTFFVGDDEIFQWSLRKRNEEVRVLKFFFYVHALKYF